MRIDTTTPPALLVHGTHGAENAEKASLPFIVGNAAVADRDTVVLELPLAPTCAPDGTGPCAAPHRSASSSTSSGRGNGNSATPVKTASTFLV